MKRFFIFLFISMFILSFASAIGFDNTIQYDESIETITFTNRWGIELFGGGKVAKAKLTDNFCDIGKFGYRKCNAKKTITLYKDSVLIQDFKTLRIDDGSWENEEIRSHKFEYYDGEELIEFNAGDVFAAGTYNVVTSGVINSSKEYDWQVMINDDWTTPWATWGNISEGDDAEVLLNSPADNFESSNFNCSANVTGGDTLVNISLYTNESGTWEAKNTTILSASFPVENLISYYEFDNDLTDSQGLNDLTDVGTTDEAGIIQRSRAFNGTGAYAYKSSFTNLPTGSSARTVCSWVYPTNVAIANKRIFSYGAEDVNELFSLELLTSGKIFFNGYSNDLTSTVDYAINDWNFICVVYNGTLISLYINGTEDVKKTTVLTTASSDLYIGRYITPQEFMAGRIDELSFWNTSLDAVNISALYNSGAGLRTSQSSATQTWNRLISVPTKWTCEACDSSGDCGFATSNRTVLSDVTPPGILVESPNGTLNINYIGGNEVLNVTFNDTNLDTCWYNYNGTNVTIDGCLSGIKNSTNFILENDNLNMTLYANDTIGNVNSSFVQWSYFVIQNSETFNANTTEGSTETFSLNYTANETPTSINFVYNGSTTSADIDSSGFPIIIASESIVIPGVDATGNLTFFWNIVSTSSTINTSSQNQTINILALDNCSSYTNVLFNYTIIDEASQAQLNGSSDNVSLEVDISIFDSSKELTVLNFSTRFNQTNPNAICSATNLFNGSSFILDSTVKYSASLHDIEYYNIRDFEINNSGSTQNITLYDIKSTESTDFQITFKNSDFVVVENALIQVQRQYVSDGTFKTVELPITDSNGQTVVHLVQNDVVYNYIVTKNNKIIGVFNNLIAFCDDATIGQCFILLNAIQGVTPAYNPDVGTGISFLPLSFNETTRDLVFTFSTNDGSVRTFVMSAVKMDQIGNNTVCNTSVTTSSGSLTCNVPGSIGNETIIVSVFVDTQLAFTSYFKAANDIELGISGFFLLLFLVISLGMMFSESKQMIIAGVILGFVTGSLLFFIKGGIIGGGSAIMWLIIMGIIMIWKLNNEGQT